MIQHFIIFGLPRTRTTWLSAFLTTDKTLCLHDHAAYSTSLPESGDYTHIGMACSGAVDEWEHWRAKYPAARLVVVRRNPDICAFRFSLILKHSPENILETCRRMAKKQDEVAALPGVLDVTFEDIDDKAEQIFEHCLPGVRLDLRRLHQLRDMNIQPDPTKLLVEVERLKRSGWNRT